MIKDIISNSTNVSVKNIIKIYNYNVKEAYFEKYFHSIYQEEDHNDKQKHRVTAVEYMCIKALEKKTEELY